jgi:hypothetical protein
VCTEVPSGNPEERDHLKDLSVDGKILHWILQDIEWILLAQDREQWRDLVNTVMNLQVL